MTPLDVVRVRLQSQPNHSPLTAIPRLATSSPHLFKPLPPDLGVTACCREVFFVNNNAELCVLGPKLGDFVRGSPMTNVDCAVEETQRRTFNSTLDGLRKIARNEGITTLWRGLSPTLVMTVPANIIYFTGYDWLRFNNASPVKKMVADAYAPLLAGASARILAATVVSPIEMFRTRMQASISTTGVGHLKETYDGIKDMVQIRGYTSLWRGLSLMLWRDVPFSGLYWWGYEKIRGSLTEARERSRGRSLELHGVGTHSRSASQSRDDHSETFLDSFIAGAVSGAFASIITMPFDVGKTRQQTFKDMRPPAANGAQKALLPEEQSIPRFLIQIFKEEGFAGLWKGWIPRTLKVAPSCAIMISCYEVGKRMAHNVNMKAAKNSGTL